MSLFVATLGYSRRNYAAPFRHERQSSWLEGTEGAFRHFGGLLGELLLDNAGALGKHHGGEYLFCSTAKKCAAGVSRRRAAEQKHTNVALNKNNKSVGNMPRSLW